MLTTHVSARPSQRIAAVAKVHQPPIGESIGFIRTRHGRRRSAPRDRTCSRGKYTSVSTTVPLYAFAGT